MLPRRFLGNWWSRYFKYTEKSQSDLVVKFEELGIPLGVVIIDMDWHLVDDAKKISGRSAMGGRGTPGTRNSSRTPRDLSNGYMPAAHPLRSTCTQLLGFGSTRRCTRSTHNF